MKSTAYLATFSFLFVKVINGDHNGLAFNENFEITNPLLQQQQPIPTYAMVNTLPDFLNQNGNNVQFTNNINDNQVLTQTKTQSPVSCKHRIQLPPDLQQQPLQVQQYLKLQEPLHQQPSLPLQQILQLQPQTQGQPISQPQYPLQIQIEAQPSSLPIQSQDILQLQPSLHSQQPLQAPIPLNLQPTLQSQDALLAQQPMPFQQCNGFKQISYRKPLTHTERQKILETLVTPSKNDQPSSQINVKWKSSNPQVVMNVEKPHNTQNVINPPQQNLRNRAVEMIANVQNSNEKPQEVSSLRYYVASPQPVPPTSSASFPVIPNSHSFPITPSNYIKPAEATHASVTLPYNYIPFSEGQHTVPEKSKSVNFISPTASVIRIPNLPIQSTNTQIHYYSPQATDSKFSYPEQPQVKITTLQSQPSALLPSQPSVLSSIPISVVQAPLLPQYGVPSGYPINTIMAPVYTNNRPKSTNLKSILPLIFNLLKEKISSCSCRNDCPCECEKYDSDNEPEITEGYSNQMDYRSFDDDGISILNTMSEEMEGPVYLRETKDCENVNKVYQESVEQEASDEEEIVEDEDS